MFTKSAFARPAVTEPNCEIAATWWPELNNVWTPIGWKNHLFRFHVVYDGTVFGQPHPDSRKYYTVPWAGLGVQIAFMPSATGDIPESAPTESHQLRAEDGSLTGNQGWHAHPTPVLWSEWKRPGIVLRHEVFAHLHGGAPVQTGTEPLYAWIRLLVTEADLAVAGQTTGFLLKINAPYFSPAMIQDRNLFVLPHISAYPRKLVAEQFGEASSPGLRLVEDDGKIRLVVLPGKTGALRFTEKSGGGRDSFLHVAMPARKGAHVDLLLPFVPGNRADVDKELAVGRERALAESDAHWSQLPETAARIETPERYINDVIAYSLKFAELIAEKIPNSKRRTVLTGSWAYTRVWATPESMKYTMLLDGLGYHEAAADYLEIYKDAQGSAPPPGPDYNERLFPNYLCVPRNLTSVDWLSDHGAILHAIAYHALITGDRKFTDRWLDTIISACEFIRDARALTGHDGVPGVLPPAKSTDAGRPLQSTWAIGWNYKGLTTATRLLKRIGHPRAKEFESEARDFKETFVKAFREKTARMPLWTDLEGKEHPVIPYTVCPNDTSANLDCGAMFLVYAGLMDADDELMKLSVRYYYDRPQAKTYDPNKAHTQPECLHHEMSSREPCYSWNVFHPHQTGDRHTFLEGMYSLFTGAMSRQTYINCETRGGMTGMVAVSPLAVHMARLAVMDDQIADNELHLLRLCPLAWISAEQETKFENIPTEFGPVSLRWQLSEDGQTLDVKYAPQFRHKPGKVILHVPPVEGLKSVRVNGAKKTVRLGERVRL